MTRKLSKAKIRAAIQGSGGLISRICTKTGYSWGAVRNMIDADPELLALVQDEEETIDDAAESTVIKKIIDGDEQSAKWWLARRRKQKFGDAVDVTSGGKVIKGYVIVSPDDWDKKDAGK